jgi:PilZ domain-containing protein
MSTRFSAEPRKQERRCASGGDKCQDPGACAKYRAHFVLQRPFAKFEVQRTLHAAYDFMLAHQRRQFRCSIVLPVRLRMVRSGAAFECSTVNISSNGIAVSGPMRVKQFDSLDLEIVLPDGFVVLATGTAIWDDQQGKCGINFQVRTPEIRQKLDTWLSAQQAAVARG